MSRLRKILKVLGLTLLFLLVVLAVIAVWLVRRAYPKTSGEIAVAGLTAPVEVRRDAWGVPHLYAQNEHDLFFAQGYTHAQDRLWQMEMNRHISSGSLSRLFGAGTVGPDRYLRTFGMRRNAERNWQLLSPETRTVLEAYAQGVNAYIDSHRGSLPIEYTILRVEPEPWTPIDSLAWVEMMAFSLGQNHSFELQRTALVQQLGEEGVRNFMPGALDTDRLIVSPEEGGYPPIGSPAVPAVPPAGALPGAVSALFSPPLQNAWLGGPRLARGSNAWVVHGSRTGTGRPILANDTHLGLDMPSVWYENGLHGGRFNAVGFSFAGLPLVIIGHNARIAWGISSMNGDAEDLYIETFNDKGQYRAGDQWLEPQIVKDAIPVSGGQPVPIEIKITRHGPIINDAMDDLKGKPPMALRWVAYDGNRTLEGILGINLASDWTSFRNALSLWAAPALNLVYADVDGHIGYQATGKLPLRAPGADGMRPADGAGGKAEWLGIVPFEEMPHLFDPPSGFIVTANNKVVADSYPHIIGHDYADPFRAERIQERLAASPHISLEEMEKLQGDVHSLAAAAFRPYLAAVKPANDLERRALDLVQKWNLEFTTDSAGAVIYYSWYRSLLPAILGDELGEEKMKTGRDMLAGQAPVFARLMKEGTSPWFDDRRTPQVETRDDIVRRSFSEAVRFLAEQLGDDPAKWQWGALHTVVFAHQPFGNTPLAKLFNGKSVPVPGEVSTIDAAVPSLDDPFKAPFGSSQRLLVDLSDLGRSLSVNSTGQSGLLFHRHREDQIEPWSRAAYHPMLYDRAAVEKGTDDKLVLKPQ
jgi:penicillin amidase